MPWAYFETNYLAGVATGRLPPVADLLAMLPLNLRVAMPAVCVMEAATAVARERNWVNGVSDACRTYAQRVRSSRHSESAQAITHHLREVQRLTIRLPDEMQTRLETSLLDLLASERFTLLPLNHHPLEQALRYKVAQQSPDNLIAYVILDHAGRQTDGPRVFFTKNARDVQTTDAMARFRQTGVTLLRTWPSFRDWLETQRS